MSGTLLHVMSGGAAKAVVASVQADYQAATGLAIEGVFTAVGAIRDRFVAGADCDVLILTQGLIEELSRSGLLVEGSAAPLGIVHTGVAAPAGFPTPDVSTSAAFAATLKGASTIYTPDLVSSTAGIHLAATFRKLGLECELTPRLRVFPNGETAMRTMAQEARPGAIGCTQITEILMTPDVVLVGRLPPEHELATVYMAAVSASSSRVAAAHQLVAMLTDTRSQETRRAKGFET